MRVSEKYGKKEETNKKESCERICAILPKKKPSCRANCNDSREFKMDTLGPVDTLRPVLEIHKGDMRLCLLSVLLDILKDETNILNLLAALMAESAPKGFSIEWTEIINHNRRSPMLVMHLIEILRKPSLFPETLKALTNGNN